jgi:hypothetical protein
MQQFCPYGSVRGASGNRRPYRDKTGRVGKTGTGYEIPQPPVLCFQWLADAEFRSLFPFSPFFPLGSTPPAHLSSLRHSTRRDSPLTSY